MTKYMLSPTLQHVHRMMFPRRLLSHHFWTEKQKVRFAKMPPRMIKTNAAVVTFDIGTHTHRDKDR